MIDLASALSANESIVPRIYEAAARPQRWSEAVEEVTDFVGCDRGFITLSYLASRKGEVVGAAGFPPDVIDAWERRYCVNEWVMLAHSLEPGALIHAAATVSVEQLLQTPMGRELLEPLEIRDAMGVKMSDSPHFVGALSTYSPAELRDSSIDRLRFLSPHLARALALYQRTQALTGRVVALEQGIDDLTTGVLLLTSAGEILHANPVAGVILEGGDGISRANGRLRLHAGDDRKALAQALDQAVRPSPGEPNRGLLRISRPSGRRPYHGVVSPVVRSLIDPGDAPAVLLWITDPEEGSVPGEQAIGTLLGLTPAEARLAAAIAGGETVRGYAQRVDISEGTARWTLKRVLAKTECSSQADLVRLVLQSIPSPPC